VLRIRIRKDPDHLAGSKSAILDADLDPRLQNWHLINLYSIEKYCEKIFNTFMLTFQFINKSYR
jgi:hypothetical protein